MTGGEFNGHIDKRTEVTIINGFRIVFRAEDM
jgi:hypothetical protein